MHDNWPSIVSTWNHLQPNPRVWRANYLGVTLKSRLSPSRKLMTGNRFVWRDRFVHLFGGRIRGPFLFVSLHLKYQLRLNCEGLMPCFTDEMRFNRKSQQSYVVNTLQVNEQSTFSYSFKHFGNCLPLDIRFDCCTYFRKGTFCKIGRYLNKSVELCPPPPTPAFSLSSQNNIVNRDSSGECEPIWAHVLG